MGRRMAAGVSKTPVRCALAKSPWTSLLLQKRQVARTPHPLCSVPAADPPGHGAAPAARSEPVNHSLWRREQMFSVEMWCIGKVGL